MLPFAAHRLVVTAILGAVITLDQFALSLCANAAAAVLVSRHPPAFEDTIDKHISILRINLPEASFPRLVLLSGDLFEALVEGQVVANGVL